MKRYAQSRAEEDIDCWASALIAEVEHSAWRSSLRIFVVCLAAIIGLAVLVYVSGRVLRP